MDQFVDLTMLANLTVTVAVILVLTSLLKECLLSVGVTSPGRFAPLIAIVLGVVIQVGVSFGLDPPMTAVKWLVATLNGFIAAYAAMKGYERHLEAEK